MKRFYSLLKTGMHLLVLPLGLLLCQTLPAAVGFTVTPPAISNQYTGMITLGITGLTNGETVTIDKFLDANTNGVIDGGDLLGQRFQLTDGQVSLIGGATNVNVPGDSNPAASDITALLNFESIDIEHIVGSYLFRLSSPAARFTPVTNAFNITNSAYLQSFTGQVRSNGTATAVANAVVILLKANQQGEDFFGGVVADNSGNYTIKAAPGTYMVFATKSNFVADLASPPLTLGAGLTVTSDLNLLPATRTISGKVADASNNAGIPGVFLVCESTDNLLAISFTDANGNFNVPVTAGGWEVGVNDSDAALHGYVRLNNSPSVITTTGSVSGVNILLPKGTAMFYGSIKDDLGNPLAGFDVYGEDQDTHQYESDGVSDANGHYAVVALAGNWHTGLSDDDPRLANYVHSGSIGNITLSNGQAVRQDFVLKPATNHITGYVRDNLSNPIAGVGVYAHATINGTNFNTGYASTDENGNYTLSVANGTWQVGVSCGCSDCDDSLSGRGYQCVSEQPATISGNNGVANFIAQPCGALQITTTSLPAARVGAFYNTSLQASGCEQPFNWSLSPGSAPLPPGMSLDSSGGLFGNPTTNGTFNFSVRVTDNNSATDDQALSLIVTLLQVTTTSLSSGTQNVYYSTQLNAAGGQPPYHWYLPGGTITLPPGTMSLSDDGILAGTPTAAGTYDFWVAVWDETSPVVATQYLSLTINAGSSPLQITTLSLPNAQQGATYTNQLQATGGQLPYSWSLAPGSLSLPPDLSLSTGGVISGAAATNGTFFFIVRVTDGSFAFTDRSLNLTINPKPTLAALNRTGSQFQLRLTGATGQNYTVQYSTNLANPNWFSLLITNPSVSPVTILDPNATNSARFYRALVGP